MEGERSAQRILRALSAQLRHLLEGWHDPQGNWHAGDLEQRLAAIGVWRDRDPISSDRLSHLSPHDRQARRVVDAYLALRREAGVSRAEAVAEFIRESAYTWANRLLALRCMEARELIDEVILQKPAYGGRSLEHHRFARRHPELCAGEDDGLFTVLDEAFRRQAKHLPRLFDADAPAVALRPSAAALRRCVALLSGTEPVRAQEFATGDVFRAADALGWAYQYWNSEEKERVFERVRTEKGAKIQGAEIVAATCIYTESYIVKFLVQNSLGAIWAAMHPGSNLPARWEYFVRDADRAPVRAKPVRDITFLDPACGSGHFLLEAFDLLYAMYEEEGEITDPQAICAAILERNLFGIDIDERAVQIAEAALWMKAAEKAPGFAGAPANLVATNLHLPKGKNHLRVFLDKHPEDAPLRPALEVVLEALQHADELGSLLQIEEPVERELRYLRERFETSMQSGVQVRLFERTVIQGELPLGVESYEHWKAKTLARLRDHFAAEAVSADLGRAFFGRSAGKGLALFDVLGRRYDVVAANPPYMGSKNMGRVLKEYVERHYAPGKRDLYAAFILRCRQLAQPAGRVAMVTQQSWMFLRSYAALRAAGRDEPRRGNAAFSGLLRETTVETLAHLGEHAFDDVAAAGAFVALFTLVNTACKPPHRLTAFRLIGPKGPEEKSALLRRAIAGGAPSVVFRPQQARFVDIPQTPLCYWLRERFFELLAGRTLGDVADVVTGLQTSNDPRFVRFVWEVVPHAWAEPVRERRWVPFEKGGGYGKWFGHHFWAVDWEHGGARIRAFPGSFVRNEDRYFSEGWTYSYMARGSLGARCMRDEVFAHKSPAILARDASKGFASVANCRIGSLVVRAISASVQLPEGCVARIPVPARLPAALGDIESACVGLKRWLAGHDPTERTFAGGFPLARDLIELHRSTAHATNAVAAVLHALEGVSERLAFDAYGLDADDMAAVLDETGKPAGWYLLLQGYDALPTLPPGLPEPPGEALELIRGHERRVPMAEELAALKEWLARLYAEGPGAGDDEDGGGDVSGEAEDEDELPLGGRIPIPAETFLEELSQKLEVHPISVYWLLREGIEREGWRCPSEERRLTADLFTFIILRLLGHRWPREVEAGEEAPEWAVPDAVIPLTEGTGAPTLLDRVRERIAAEFAGGDVAAVEREFAEVMGAPLNEWLATEFFRHHCRQFRRRPIAWQIQSGRSTARGRPAFACLVYYHSLDGATLTAIQSQYVRPLRQRYETELRSIEGVPVGARSDRQESRRAELELWISELRDFDAALERVAADGFASDALAGIVAAEPLDRWCSPDGVKPAPQTREALARQERAYLPDLNDGVRVNIAPLQRAGLLAADVLPARDVEKAIADRAGWRADERRWCRQGTLPRPGWWPKEALR